MKTKTKVSVINKVAQVATTLATPMVAWLAFGSDAMRVAAAIVITLGAVGAFWLFNRVLNESTFQPKITEVATAEITPYGAGFVAFALLPLLLPDLIWGVYIPAGVLYAAFLQEKDTVPLNPFTWTLGYRVFKIQYEYKDEAGLTLAKAKPELYNPKSPVFYSGDGNTFIKVR